MTELRRYQLLTLAVLLIGAYVLATEVLGRWADTYQMIIETSEKKEGILAPEEIAERRLKLLAEKWAVTGRLSLAAKLYDQNVTGVFEFLSNAAKDNGIKFRSLVPSQSDDKGEIRQIGFKIVTRAGFHQMGAFLNRIETGELNVRVETIELVSNNPFSSSLTVTLAGKALVSPSSEGHAK